MTPSSKDDNKGLSDSLRSAIEGTFQATAGSAGETKEKAGELLDEVAKRGREARAEVVRRRDDVVRVGSEASADVVHKVEEELRSISERLAKLEASLRRDRS